jgi:hypothetical protein
LNSLRLQGYLHDDLWLSLGYEQSLCSVEISFYTPGTYFEKEILRWSRHTIDLSSSPRPLFFFLRLRQFAEALLIPPFVLCSLSSTIPRISNKMVSLLWKACSEGDLQKVQELLEEPNSVDIELKGEYDRPSTEHTCCPCHGWITDPFLLLQTIRESLPS